MFVVGEATQARTSGVDRVEYRRVASRWGRALARGQGSRQTIAVVDFVKTKPAVAVAAVARCGKMVAWGVPDTKIGAESPGDTAQ